MGEPEQSRDARLLERMLERTSAYERGLIGLGALITDLDALNGLLSAEFSDRRGDAFRSHWGVLEEVLAIMLEENRTDLDDLDRALVDRSLADLENLVRAELLR